MVELSTRTLIDFGLKRKNAIVVVSVLGFLLGLPSALSLDFLVNQDWVWGVGLILSGAFISFSIIRYGIDNFRKEKINGFGSDVKIGRWFNYVIGLLIPIQVVVLIVWWLVSSVGWDPQWWNPFRSENFGTVIFQWIIILTLFILINKYLVKKVLEVNSKSQLTNAK
jgi:NSS family neurotransmitter:Na+ symporter